jgi:hypothetical protein
MSRRMWRISFAKKKLREFFSRKEEHTAAVRE